jgi:hypothetical protein
VEWGQWCTVSQALNIEIISLTNQLSYDQYCKSYQFCLLDSLADLSRESPIQKSWNVDTQSSFANSDIVQTPVD